jgi:phenylacetate-coenzyme A ligase PaaK-like adenylate-forming protein
MPTTNDRAKSLAELDRALRLAPAYRAWRTLDPGPAADVDERYAALPVTTNARMREESPHGFVPENTDLELALAEDDAEMIRTSGTTGVPIPLVWSGDWWEASERLSWALNAVARRVATGEHREAVLASPRCVGPGESALPLSLEDRTMDGLLFVNERASVDWTDDEVRRMHGELWAHAPVIVEADPPYLAALLARTEALGLTLPSPELVVFTYARPSAILLARLERVMPAPVASSYGSTETGYVLLSCEEGRMHQNVASCRIDVAPVEGREDLARLIVTPFGHPWMCLLRFDVGDIVRLAHDRCPCGNAAGLQVDRIEGRVGDVTLRADGGKVTLADLDDALASAKSSEQIISYQVVQPRPGELLVRATTAGQLDADAIRHALQGVYGQGSRIGVEPVRALTPEPSGKYAAVRRSSPTLPRSS